MRENKLYKYFKKKISESTGIPEKELTFRKIQTLSEQSDYPGAIQSRTGGKIEIGRQEFTRDEILKRRKRVDEFLEKYKKPKATNAS